MTTIAPALAVPFATSRRPGGGRPWAIGVASIGVLGAVLTGWGVWAGSLSAYYASIALSMSESWSNFFFGAIDPAGTVTLDKIPGSFWIPALFVRVFGYSTWAVILPNSLAAVAASLLVAFTVRRFAGTSGGLIAGAVVAVTPILVAVARSNQPETFFVLGLALTGWAALRAIERPGPGRLTVAGLCIALSFQFYMLEAWAVWPALGLAYLCTRQSWLRRILHLLLAGVVSLAASLWWVVIVSLIPADARPYIGSTLYNSPWEMVFGYNGLGRFSATADADAYRSFTPPFSGDPGLLRLFNAELIGQIAWLIPASAAALVVLWLIRVPRAIALLVTVWFVTFAGMFSLVDGMHQFYTAALAVPMALAIGLAVGLARRRGLVWPVVLLVGTAGATAVVIGVTVSGYSVVFGAIQAVAAAIAIALLLTERRHRLRMLALAATTVGLLLTPAVWSAVTIAHPSATNPVAGGVSDTGTSGGSGTASGSSQRGSGRGGQDSSASEGRGRSTTDGSAAGVSSGSDASLIDWLEQNQGDASYLAAAFGAQTAAQLIIDSGGQSVLPIGGFNGADPVPTLDAFEQLVADGELRYVIVGGLSTGGGISGTGSTGTSADIRSWVLQNCTVASGAPSDAVYDCS
ncbi:MAG: glycosyltransferase family 39 protein [Microbacterium sp.]